VPMAHCRVAVGCPVVLDGDDGADRQADRYSGYALPCIHQWHEDCVGVGYPGRKATHAVFASPAER